MAGQRSDQQGIWDSENFILRVGDFSLKDSGHIRVCKLKPVKMPLAGIQKIRARGRVIAFCLPYSLTLPRTLQQLGQVYFFTFGDPEIAGL